MKPGMNIDIRQIANPEFFLDNGHTLRTVLKADGPVNKMRNRLQIAKDVGAEIIAIINIGESYKASWHLTNGDLKAARWFQEKYGDLVTYFQLENEPDLPQTALSTVRYNEMFYWWAQVVTKPILSPAQGSGSTAWLDALLLNGDYTQVWHAICYHQYSDNTTELFNLFSSYGLPVWITEWGFNIDNDALQAQLITRRLIEYSTMPIDRALYFCGGCGVDHFQLVNTDGSPREGYAAYFGGV